MCNSHPVFINQPPIAQGITFSNRNPPDHPTTWYFLNSQGKVKSSKHNAVALSPSMQMLLLGNSAMQTGNDKEICVGNVDNRLT